MSYSIYEITIQDNIKILSSEEFEDFPCEVVDTFDTPEQRNKVLIQRIRQISLNPDLHPDYVTPSQYLSSQRDKLEDRTDEVDVDDWFHS